MPAARIYKRATYFPGHILMTQGENGTTAYIIERGRVEVNIRDVVGNKVVLADLGPGDIVGEMALITQEPRSANAIVLEESVLLQVTSSDFAEGLRRTDGTFQTLVTVLTDRLRTTNNTFLQAEYSLEALETKVRATIEHVAKNIGGTQRESFRREVMPVLTNLLNILKKYKTSKP